MSRTMILMAALLFTVANVSSGQSADNRPAAYIISPKEGALVGRTSELTGKTFLRGQPFALVRTGNGNGKWWVQRGVQRNERGQLQGTLQFGNEMAEPGSKFAFVVVVVRTPLELEFFTKHESLVELPQNVPRSEIRHVVLDKPLAKEPEAAPEEDPPVEDPPVENPPVENPPVENPPVENPPVENPPAEQSEEKPADKPTGKAKDQPNDEFDLTILKPRNMVDVTRFEELIGRTEFADRDSEPAPIVLVRPEGIGEQWWVQDQVVFGEGKYFKTQLRFGNAMTGAGTRFMILVVAPKPGLEAKAMKPGAAFAKLPPGIRRSKAVIVQLASPMPMGAE